MESSQTIIDLVTAYLPGDSDTERAELATELQSLASGLVEAFLEDGRFDESRAGMVDSDSSPSGL